MKLLIFYIINLDNASKHVRTVLISSYTINKLRILFIHQQGNSLNLLTRKQGISYTGRK